MGWCNIASAGVASSSFICRFVVYLRMFQMSILVPFLPGMESSCSWSSDSDLKRECVRMALRLASESSVITKDCEGTKVKEGWQAGGTNIHSYNE